MSSVYSKSTAPLVNDTEANKTDTIRFRCNF